MPKKKSDSESIEILKKLCKQTADTQKSVTDMDKKLDLHIQKMDYELSDIKQTNTVQNEVLEQHHQRSDELARDNDLREQAIRGDMAEHEARIENLEAPQKWAKTTWKVLLGLGALAAATFAVGRVFGWF